MNLFRRIAVNVLAAGTVLAAGLAPQTGHAADPSPGADFPTRAVRILVGFAPGGGTDITARIIAKRLAEQLRQQVVVENRAGGGGVVAMELLANSAPDGHTILLATVGPFAVTPHMQKVSYEIGRAHV